jgi:hypothetical protein
MVQYALNAADDFNRFPGAPLNDGFGSEFLDSWKYQGISPPGQPHNETNAVQMNQAYGTFQNQTGPLGTKETQIQTRYTCSVPVKKGAATRFHAHAGGRFCIATNGVGHLQVCGGEMDGSKWSHGDVL